MLKVFQFLLAMTFCWTLRATEPVFITYSATDRASVLPAEGGQFSSNGTPLKLPMEQVHALVRSQRNRLIYIHGFRDTLESSYRDLKELGLLNMGDWLIIDWPSGKLSHYLNDALVNLPGADVVRILDNAEVCGKALAQELSDLTGSTGLFAHSMGGHFFASFLREWKGPSLGPVALVAPCTPYRAFEADYHKLRSRMGPLTVYAGSTDKVLGGAHFIKGRARRGDDERLLGTVWRPYARKASEYDLINVSCLYDDGFNVLGHFPTDELYKLDLRRALRGEAVSAEGVSENLYEHRINTFWRRVFRKDWMCVCLALQKEPGCRKLAVKCAKVEVTKLKVRGGALIPQP